MDTLHRIRWANVGLVAACLILLVTVARTVASGPPPATPPDEPVPIATPAAERADIRNMSGSRRVRRQKPRVKQARQPNRRPERPRLRRRQRPKPTTTPAPRPAAQQPQTYDPPPPAIEFGFERP